MARRKAPTLPPAREGDLPPELRRERVCVETFVGPQEQPPSWWGSSVSEWRQLRAFRRWQDAVESWGMSQGMDRQDLMEMHVWPTSPPRFRGGV